MSKHFQCSHVVHTPFPAAGAFALPTRRQLNSQTDLDFRASLLRSDLCPLDGMPIVWIARLSGIRITRRIAGSDITFGHAAQLQHGPACQCPQNRTASCVMARGVTLPFSLLVKSKIIGSRIEDLAKRARWLVSARQRAKYPELWELYLEEKRLPAVLATLLKPTSCGVDVGAHIGSFLSLLIRFAPQGHHAAIEPSVTKSRWLKQHFPGVTIFPVAASDQNGQAIFEEDHTRPGYSRLQADTPQRNVSRYEVCTRRLDDLPIKRVDLLKLDIEGAELIALRGATQLIKMWRPAILFECGSEYATNKIDRPGLYQYLTEILGYDVYSFTDFLFREKGPMTFDEFRKCGIYPFRAFNFVALVRPTPHYL